MPVACSEAGFATCGCQTEPTAPVTIFKPQALEGGQELLSWQWLRRTQRHTLASQLKNQYQRKTMPTYHVEMMEGRTLDQKKKLVEAITRVSVEILGGVPDSVDIIITDIKRENWSTGGKLWSEPRE